MLDALIVKKEYFCCSRSLYSLARLGETLRRKDFPGHQKREVDVGVASMLGECESEEGASYGMRVAPSPNEDSRMST